MDTTAPPFPPPPAAAAPGPARAPANGGRTGALWLTGLGAFMLFAAAAVFVAVRWDSLGDQVRLAILAAITGACLLAGRRLRPSLPATALVLSHLGAFLLPVNTAAIAVHLELTWPSFLLVEGAVAALTWWVLARTEASKVLHVAAATAVVITAGGASSFAAAELGAAVPTAVFLATAALAAELTGRHRHAIGWGLLAGLAPCFAMAERVLPLKTDVLHTLGLAGTRPLVGALATAAVSAAVLARNARRRDDALLVSASFLTVLVGLASARTGVVADVWFDIVGLATLFLVAEAVAHVTRRDPFWSGATATVAVLAEGLAAWLVPAFGIATIWLHVDRPAATDPMALLAGAATIAAFLVADLRRASDVRATDWLTVLRGSWAASTFGIAASAAVAVAAATPDAAVISSTFVAIATVLLVVRRPGAAGAAPLLVIAAPLIAPTAGLVGGLGVGGALVLTVAAVAATRTSQPGQPSEAGQDGKAEDRSVPELVGWNLALLGLLTAFETAAVLWGDLPRHQAPALLVGLAVTCWALAAIADVGRVSPPLPRWGLGLAGRVGALCTVGIGAATEPGWWAAAAGIVGFLAVVDAVRHDDPLPLWSLPIAVPACVGAATFAATGDPLTAGVSLCVTSVVAAGLLALAEPAWRPPLIATLGVAAGVGLLLTSSQPGPFGLTLILLGSAGLVLSAAFRVVAGTPFAGLLITGGVWLRLGEANVDALEPYVAPVAVALLVAGWWSDRRPDGAEPLSSWVTYGPAVALLAGSALVERFDGGHGVHAVVAGVIAVVAVVAGGGRRLVAPLAIGTATLVALTIHESLGVTRQVPTWGWLALGGTVLVTAGLLLERMETGPLETGRRLVDVVHDRYR